MAVHLGIRDHVVFTGMVPPSEVHTYYQLGDIFVSASIQNPEWCKAAGAHSKEIAAMYDKGHFADQIADVYEKVISE